MFKTFLSFIEIVIEIESIEAMESAISVDPLTPGFSPSAVRTLTGAAQMSQYSSGGCGPYSNIFNVSSVLAEHLNATRVQAFGLSPASAAAAMLHNRIPDQHHHNQCSLLSLQPESVSTINVCTDSPLNNNMTSDLSSPAPSTDGESIGDHYHADDSMTAPEETKLFTLKRAIRGSNHYGSKGLDCNPTFAPKEQENNLLNGNKNRCTPTPKKSRMGKTVSITL